MMPPKSNHNNFEKVRTGDFINGEISEIKYDMEHKFSWKGSETVQPGVRLVFKLEGYSFPHYSGWMKFNYGEKSNLYGKFLKELVENAKPDFEFDLDDLKGLKIKSIWADNGDYQNIKLILPLEGKVGLKAPKTAETAPATPAHDEPEDTSDDIPF